MNRLKIAATVLLATLLLSTGHAFAWGPEGHAMIAEIAEMRLSDQAKAQVADLLSRDDSNAEHLDEIASWADAVRPVRKETAPWHFVDIPLMPPSTTRSTTARTGIASSQPSRSFPTCWPIATPIPKPDWRP